MCKQKEKEDPPDYNARLGYGTDQGRWLVEQVGARDGVEVVRRPSRQPSRVFHDPNEMEPPPPQREAAPKSASAAPSAGIQAMLSSVQQQAQELVSWLKASPKYAEASVSCLALVLILIVIWVLR